ncbi:MAG: hypothetical protein ACREIU_15860, partial [Planctomycetota bacterium]
NYGAASATKPRITGLSGSFVVGGVLTITGTNFAATGNTVWFTSAAATGAPKTVTGLASTGAGTSIAVTSPATLPLPVDGDLLVLVPPGTQGAHLSNAWPIDISSGPPPTLATVGPNPAPIASQTTTLMTITGTDLSSVSSVSVGGVSISGAALTTSPTQVTFNLPNPLLALNLGPISVTATNPSGTSNALPLTIDPATPPALILPSLTATGQPFSADTYTVPGNFVILIMSPSNLPSSVPGVVDLNLGAGFTQILLFPTLVAGAAQGRATTSFVVPPGGTPLSVFYFQSISIPPGFASPFPSSNMLQTTLLF